MPHAAFFPLAPTYATPGERASAFALVVVALVLWWLVFVRRGR